MKRLTIMATLAVVATLAYGEVVKLGPATPPDPVKEQERRAAKRLAKLKKTGGRIVDMSTMKGKFVFVNCQKSVQSEKVKDVVERLGRHFMSDFSIADGKSSVTVENAGVALAENGATAAVYLVDSKSLPPLLLAPESKWAMVNVAALASDGADAAKLERRVKREMMRAFAGVSGGCGSMDPLCVSRTVTSLSELDALKSGDLSAEPMYRAEDALKAMGITPFRKTTYREACEEGWAPSPTNEYQKVVWEQVHAVPKNPMKIEFDPKKGK